MPVVKLELDRLSRLVKADKDKIIDRLPYIGLDIEGIDGNTVRVEYSPNRPDFSTDFGIARALKGLLGIELGLPRYAVKRGNFNVMVDERLGKIRPFIACVIARGLRLSGEDIRQFISMQEDLHNGIGRKRRKLAIGFHDLAKVKPPIFYDAVGGRFSFTPLDYQREMTIEDILNETEAGKLYRSVLPDSKLYPILRDSDGNVLSFPPIINGNVTKVTESTVDLLVDVTSTDMGAGDNALAIIATTLAEAGAGLESVKIISKNSKRITPMLKPSSMRIDVGLIRKLTGLDIDIVKIRSLLAKCRIGVRGNLAIIPPYRIDIMHPVDIAEEVALGYGIDRIGPVYPVSKAPGRLDTFGNFLEQICDIMIGVGAMEVMTYELVDELSLYKAFGRSGKDRIEVEDPKSIEHSILRDSLIPSLMLVLSKNVKEEYPQRIFEIGKVYSRNGSKIDESWRLGMLVAHSSSNYTEAKMYLESVFRSLFGAPPDTRPADSWAFIEGRSASINLMNLNLGCIGEIKPSALSFFGLGVPVSGFEINLSSLFTLVSKIS